MPSRPKKSFTRRMCGYLTKKFFDDSSSPSPSSPQTRRVRFDESVHEDQTIKNPNELKGRLPTRYGHDETNYLTEDEIEMCYGTLNPNKELKRVVYQIYDLEFKRTFDELKTIDKSNLKTRQEVIGKIGSRKEFFAKYQDAIEVKQENQVIEQAQEEWFNDVNERYSKLNMIICFAKTCGTIAFGYFLSKYFNLLGGGSRKKRQRKTRKQR